MMKENSGLKKLIFEIKLELDRIRPMFVIACERKRGVIDMRDDADKLFYDEYLCTSRIYDKLVLIADGSDGT